MHTLTQPTIWEVPDDAGTMIEPILHECYPAKPQGHRRVDLLRDSLDLTFAGHRHGFMALEVVPLRFNHDVPLIDAVGIVGDAQVRSTPSVECWSIALDPVKYGRLIDREAPFPQEFSTSRWLKAFRRCQRTAQRDHIGFKVAPFERCRITHGRFPAIKEWLRLALCFRSPAMPATEPSGLTQRR